MLDGHYFQYYKNYRLFQIAQCIVYFSVRTLHTSTRKNAGWYKL